MSRRFPAWVLTQRPDTRITIASYETGVARRWGRAIRDDITANLDAIDDLVAANPPLDLILVESGGDNLTETFSTGLIDVQIFVIDVAGGIGQHKFNAAGERAFQRGRRWVTVTQAEPRAAITAMTRKTSL